METYSFLLLNFDFRVFAATKATIGGEVTDTLAKSCLISFELKHKRASHYTFDLNTVSEVREPSFKVFSPVFIIHAIVFVSLCY